MANVNCDGAVRMCRAARVTIHQRQQIVINKAQLKARGREADRQAGRRAGRQAGRQGRWWIYFSADAKARVRGTLSRGGSSLAGLARANDSRNESLLINEAHWRNAHNTNHRL